MGNEQRDAGFRLIDRLVAAYSAHSVEDLRACFAESAKVRDDAWGESHEGPTAIGRAYERDFGGSPDIEAWIVSRFVSTDAVGAPALPPLAVELVVRGTHLGTWRGLPATGARFELRVFNVFRFTHDAGHIVENRFSYDRASLLRQLGVLHDPTTLVGRTLTAITHPMTMAKVAGRRLSSRPSAGA